MSDEFVIAEKELALLEQAIAISRLFPSNLGWVFRGQANFEWDLLPSAGRPPHFRSSFPPDPLQPPSRTNPPPDLGRFNHWRNLACAYREILPANDFECLALAQHFGLPTRLLDFSSNILVALYFACESHFDFDGCVFAYLPDLYIDPEVCSFYEIPESGLLQVRPFERRFLHQSARLMFFEDPSTPLQSEPLPPEMAELRKVANLPDSTLIKFSIPKKAKVFLLDGLERIGVSRSTLFPDLEGLSQEFVLRDVLASVKKKSRTGPASDGD